MGITRSSGVIMNPCPILVINLASSVERRREMEVELAAHGLEAEFIAAVDGRLMSPAERDAVCAQGTGDYFLRLSAGEIGCYLSHLKAAETIVTRGWPQALVLEDDARLAPDFSQRLRALCCEASDRYDLIKLAGKMGTHLRTQTLSIGDRLVRYRRPPSWTLAQFWTREGAEKFLQYGRPLRRPVDVQIKHWWELELKVVTLSPEWVFPNERHNATSTIGAAKKMSPVARWRQLGYKLRYAVANYRQSCRELGVGEGTRLCLGPRTAPD